MTNIDDEPMGDLHKELTGTIVPNDTSTISQHLSKPEAIRISLQRYRVTIYKLAREVLESNIEAALFSAVHTLGKDSAFPEGWVSLRHREWLGVALLRSVPFGFALGNLKAQGLIEELPTELSEPVCLRSNERKLHALVDSILKS
jgi:hypothetical protein